MSAVLGWYYDYALSLLIYKQTNNQKLVFAVHTTDLSSSYLDYLLSSFFLKFHWSMIFKWLNCFKSGAKIYPQAEILYYFHPLFLTFKFLRNNSEIFLIKTEFRPNDTM